MLKQTHISRIPEILFFSLRPDRIISFLKDKSPIESQAFLLTPLFYFLLLFLPFSKLLILRRNSSGNVVAVGLQNVMP